MAVGAHVRDDYIYARERLQVPDIEFRIFRMFFYGLVIISNASIAVGESQRAKVAALKSLHPVGSVFGYIAAAENRIVHDEHGAPTSRTRISGDSDCIDEIKIAVGADG